MKILDVISTTFLKGNDKCNKPFIVSHEILVRTRGINARVFHIRMHKRNEVVETISRAVISNKP
jgi:hypothetical protein